MAIDGSPAGVIASATAQKLGAVGVLVEPDLLEEFFLAGEMEILQKLARALEAQEIDREPGAVINRAIAKLGDVAPGQFRRGPAVNPLDWLKVSNVAVTRLEGNPEEYGYTPEQIEVTRALIAAAEVLLKYWEAK